MVAISDLESSEFNCGDDQSIMQQRWSLVMPDFGNPLFTLFSLIMYLACMRKCCGGKKNRFRNNWTISKFSATLNMKRRAVSEMPCTYLHTCTRAPGQPLNGWTNFIRLFVHHIYFPMKLKIQALKIRTLKVGPEIHNDYFLLKGSKIFLVIYGLSSAEEDVYRWYLL